MAIRGEPKAHQLYLLRHADAEGDQYGLGDASRGLSRDGRAQARLMAELLGRTTIDLVLCSTATRAKQTTQLLGLAAPIRHLPRLYNANARQVLAELAAVDDAIHSVLVVGHAPGLPSLAYSLATPDSDAGALALIRPVFPPATLVGLEFFGGWSGLSQARVFRALLTDPAAPQR
ncbi:MAG: histidine phosphatase family protein [Propionicimonas sp.]|jgi:phosphohistidine phosphatase